MNQIAIENLSKKFRINIQGKPNALAKLVYFFSGKKATAEIQALKNVSLFAEAGELVGLIGKNGAGKSTLLRCLAGIYRPDSGRIKISGKLIYLINLSAAFKIELSMRDNILLFGAFFGLSQQIIKERLGSIVELAGLADFIDTKISQFSMGMEERLSFSLAYHCQPEVFILDDFFNSVDNEFKKRALTKLKIMAENGAIILLCSHDLEMVGAYCSKTVWLEQGKVAAIGPTAEVVNRYRAQSI